MKTFEGWYCAHCQRGVDASEVTFYEQHTVCGRTITDDTPPEPPVKESLTTEQPEDGPVAWMVDYGDGSDPEVYEGKRPPGVAVECSVAPLYPESVKAERDALRAENAELRERVKELEADAAMLDQMQDECWNVECEAYPIADSGDSDIEWRVFSSHMAEPRRREIGYGRTPREALNAAMREGE